MNDIIMSPAESNTTTHILHTKSKEIESIHNINWSLDFEVLCVSQIAMHTRTFVSISKIAISKNWEDKRDQDHEKLNEKDFSFDKKKKLFTKICFNYP